MLLVAVLLLAGSSAGERKEGDEVLVADEHLAIPISLEKGEDLEIRIFVAVTDGPKIDVFWMTEEAYEEYQFGDEFDHYVDYSVIGSRSVDTTFEWDGEGTYFVIIDNTARETVPPADPDFSNATLHYVVTWGPADQGTRARDWAVYTIVVVMTVFVVYLAQRYLRRRK
jgi:hypothetical protein